MIILDVFERYTTNKKKIHILFRIMVYKLIIDKWIFGSPQYTLAVFNKLIRNFIILGLNCVEQSILNFLHLKRKERGVRENIPKTRYLNCQRGTLNIPFNLELYLL